jgi:uncharacterized membrane protein
MSEARRSGRATMAGILIGVGMGGFVDGIVLHQILQWHNMLSHVVPPHTMDTMRVNMTWDGLFHALTWVITLVGILQLRRAAYAHDPMPSARAFTGQLILGWGIFNLVEGVIDHRFWQRRQCLLGAHSKILGDTGPFIPARSVSSPRSDFHPFGISLHFSGVISMFGGERVMSTTPLLFTMV